MNDDTSGQTSNIRLLLFILVWLGGVLIGFHELNVQVDSPGQMGYADSHSLQVIKTVEDPTLRGTILVGRSPVKCSNASTYGQPNFSRGVFGKAYANVVFINSARFSFDSAKSTVAQSAAIISGDRLNVDNERYSIFSFKSSYPSNLKTALVSGCLRFRDVFPFQTKDSSK
jgi:hypothetical protein